MSEYSFSAPGSRRRSRQFSAEVPDISADGYEYRASAPSAQLSGLPDALDSLLASSGGFTDALDSLVSDVRSTASSANLRSGCSSRASSSGSGGGRHHTPPTGYAPNYSLEPAPPAAPSVLHPAEVLSLHAAPMSEVRGSSAPYGGLDPVVNEQHGVFVSSCPSGHQLQMDILTTWGDPYYVGLSALEVFDEYGHPIELAEPHLQVTAEPADINVLPEYGHDVRVVANLFDGTFRTCDDAHLWLAPFTPGQRNHVFVDLGAVRAISMVRVWNYNKSRTHSFRGARVIELRLDGNLVFRGEINKAPGCLHEVDKAAEPILFTMDPDVLHQIDEHDRQLFEYEPVAELPSLRERPPTAERHLQHGESGQRALRPSEEDVPEAVRSALSRPRTAAFDAMVSSCCNAGQQQHGGLPPQPTTPPHGSSGGSGGSGFGACSGGGETSASGVPTLSMLQDYMTHVHPAGRVVTLVLVSTWGDPHYIGLNGVELLGPSGAPLRVDGSQLISEPPSIAMLPQLRDDPRTVDKLVDGVNSSYDDRHMFLAPFTPGRSNTVRLDLRTIQPIAAVRLWNYSKTATRGVRSFEVLIDGSLVYQGTARPAPLRQGSALHATSDFVQTVLFTDNEDVIRAEIMNVYTHEDLEDGLQIFDNGQKIAGSNGQRVEDVVRPSTSVVGAAPPTARRGARPVLGAPPGGGQSSSRLHANPQAAMAAAQARSAAQLRRPVGSGR